MTASMAAFRPSCALRYLWEQLSADFDSSVGRHGILLCLWRPRRLKKCCTRSVKRGVTWRLPRSSKATCLKLRYPRWSMRNRRNANCGTGIKKPSSPMLSMQIQKLLWMGSPYRIGRPLQLQELRNQGHASASASVSGTLCATCRSRLPTKSQHRSALRLFGTGPPRSAVTTASASGALRPWQLHVLERSSTCGPLTLPSTGNWLVLALTRQLRRSANCATMGVRILASCRSYLKSWIGQMQSSCLAMGWTTSTESPCSH
mmetsp:Transcript_66680/g.184619  ORF Transcript_66680/g.184619 Transcript_66680/m.184619 type:complete len:260 (-) Transcript_66680:594-1373(-)